MIERPAMLGTTPVVVRFDYEPEDLGHGAHPDYSASVEIQEVCIGGIWIGTMYLDDDWISTTEKSLLEQHHKALQNDHDEAAWERQQEAREESGYP